jgi:hypothetical protein
MCQQRGGDENHALHKVKDKAVQDAHEPEGTGIWDADFDVKNELEDIDAERIKKVDSRASQIDI